MMRPCNLMTMAAASTLMTLPRVDARAAAIIWQAPVNETGAVSDILTSGTFVDSATAGSTTTVGGVTFNGQTGSSGGVLSFGGGSQISLNSPGQQPYGSGGSAPSTWNAGYRTLVSGAAYNGSTVTSILGLNGLTIGQQYTVQIFEAFWNYNWATTFSDGTNVSAQVNLSGGVYTSPGDIAAGPSSVPEYLLGSFTANTTTQAIYLSSSTDYSLFDAIQVRTTGDAVSTPEPSGLVLILTAMLGLGGLRLFQRQQL